MGNGIMVKVEVEFRDAQRAVDTYDNAAVDVAPGLFIIRGSENILAVYPQDVVHRVHYPNGESRIARLS